MQDSQNDAYVLTDRLRALEVRRLMGYVIMLDCYVEMSRVTKPCFRSYFKSDLPRFAS